MPNGKDAASHNDTKRIQLKQWHNVDIKHDKELLRMLFLILPIFLLYLLLLRFAYTSHIYRKHIYDRPTAEKKNEREKSSRNYLKVRMDGQSK